MVVYEIAFRRVAAGVGLGILFFHCAQAQSAQLRELTPADATAWKSLRSAELTADGTWLVYTTNSASAGVEVIARSLRDGTEWRYQAGLADKGAGNVQVSASGKWVGFQTARLESTGDSSVQLGFE
jgi:hypothetical protein